MEKKDISNQRLEIPGTVFIEWPCYEYILNGYTFMFN